MKANGPGSRRGRFVLDSLAMPTLVTRTYLELRSPEDLRPAPAGAGGEGSR